MNRNLTGLCQERQYDSLFRADSSPVEYQNHLGDWRETSGGVLEDVAHGEHHFRVDRPAGFAQYRLI